MAKAVGASPRPSGRGQGRGGDPKTVGAWPKPWGCGQGRGGVAKGQGCGGVGMAMGALPRTRGVAKAVRANPNPNPKAVEA